MGLEAKYEVLKMLRDEGVQSFRAKEIATGRSLELHLFPPLGKPENKVLFEKLTGLPLEAQRHFLDRGTDGSTPYLVTDPLPEGRGFKAWAEALLAGTKTMAPTTPPSRPFASGPSSPAELRASDDSVRILQAGQWRTGTPIPESLVSKPAPPPRPAGEDYTVMFQPPASPARPHQPAPEAGEFTGLFQQREPTGPAQAPSRQIAETPESGEFTRMFQNLQAKPAATTAAPQQAAPGEFTKLFESPLQPSATGPIRPETEWSAPAPSPPASQSSKPVGEFTKVFGEPASAAPTGVSFDPHSPAAGGFDAGPSATEVFSAGGQQARAPLPPTFASGPSEYTKMTAAPSVPTMGQTPGSISADPSPSLPKRSNTALFIAIGAGVVVVICILLFFLTR
jgi:hypothetical protein